MKPSHFIRSPLLALCLFWIAGCSLALGQTAGQEYQPEVGQEGKDVVWVPTPQALVERMLDIAKVTPRDFVIDLGSGDGRTVITAAKRGARALGIEYNPDMIALSRRSAAREGVSDMAQFIQGDLYESDFSRATVITLFLLPEINLDLRPKILDLRPGTRIVSNTFDMGEWEPDETATVSNCETYCTALLWIVPAKVEGTWQLPQGELTLTQSFQEISGRLRSAGQIAPITDGKLRGDQISFNVAGAQYTGRVKGNAMEGTVKSPGGSTVWNATRTSKRAAAPGRY